MTLEEAKQIKHYISSFCSKSHDKTMTIFCNDLIRNYIICHMSVLFEEKYDLKMDTWIERMNNSLLKRLERF